MLTLVATVMGGGEDKNSFLFCWQGWIFTKEDEKGGRESNQKVLLAVRFKKFDCDSAQEHLPIHTAFARDSLSFFSLDIECRCLKQLKRY